jgi:serine/threonine-protein kinase
MAVRKVGTSRITRELGRGGMSIVYEGYQEALDRKVAVKALEARGAHAKELVERFRREGRAYAQIHHANIIAVHDLVEKDEALYLVVEFVDGADLNRVLGAGGRLPAECVAAVGTRAADALDCVHGHNLLHRDVKPGNLMIARTGTVKLMDFGIVKDPLISDLTKTGTVVGTPYYLAPEVLGGDAEDERSDLWALGVTLYELATGSRPFTGDDYQALFLAVRKGRLQPIRDAVPGFPRRLARAIERCLDKNPERRWESAGALAEELGLCAGRLLGRIPPAKRLADLLQERQAVPPRQSDAEEAEEDEVSEEREAVALDSQELELPTPAGAETVAPRLGVAIPWRLVLALLAGAAAWAWWAKLLPWP